MKPADPRLLRYAHATRGYLAVCVVLGGIGAGLTVATATLLADGIARVFLARADLSDLRWSIVALAAVVAARAVVAWAQEVAAGRASAAVKTQLRGRLLRHLVQLGPGWLTGQRSGELSTLAGHGLDALDAYFAKYLPQLVLAGLVPAIVLLRIAPADTVATVTIVVTLPLIPIFMALVGLHTEQTNQRQYRLLSRLSHHFLDVVTGLPTLKAFRRDGAQQATIGKVTDEYRKVTMRTLRIAFLSSLILELLATLSVAMVAVGIGLRLVYGRLDLSTALLILILAPEAYLPLRLVGANFHASAEGLAAAQEVFTVLETPIPTSTGQRRPPDPGTVALRLAGVTVNYPERPVPALADFDLEVHPGEIVALTGPSGSGKSTVISTLLGFVRPDAGSVYLGETDLAEVDLAAWREMIAWVPQHPYLFAGTIADNIRLGATGERPCDATVSETQGCRAVGGAQGDPVAGGPTAGDPAVVAAARAAGAHEFIMAMPEGYQTVLQDGGTGLSAGQRQRIALARAFIRDAAIVLLDEPTASLDRRAEAEVLDSVRALASGRTVVIAAHRPALVAMADRIVQVSR